LFRMIWGFRRAVSRALRVCAIALAMIGFLIATTGVIPNPSYLTKLATGIIGERYPCEGGRCMCASARECWTTCQCHTLSQRVAWAEREGVAIPSYVDLSDLEAGVCEPSKPACPLCAMADGAGDEENEQTPAPLQSANGLPTLSPIGCKGVQMLLAFGAIVTVTVPPMEFDAACTPVVRTLRDMRLEPPMPCAEIPTPPPRSFSA